MNIEKTCGVCGRVITVRVDPEHYARWTAGELIQRALPELSTDDRELLISGTCGDCFDKLFPPDEEEDE